MRISLTKTKTRHLNNFKSHYTVIRLSSVYFNTPNNSIIYKNAKIVAEYCFGIEFLWEKYLH